VLQPTAKRFSPKVVIPYQFDDAGPFSEGLAAVGANGKWGYVDARETVIEPKFSRAKGFSEGLAAVMVDEK